MAKIIGNTTATPNPRSNWSQNDPTKADYIKNKPAILTEEEIIELIAENNNGSGSNASQIQADWAQTDPAKADYIKNRTHYEEMGWSDTLIWDGQDTVVSVPTPEGDFYLVSSYIPDKTLLDTVSYVIEKRSDGEEWELSLSISDDYARGADMVITFKKDVEAIDYCVFPEPGIYLNAIAPPDLYIKSVTTPGCNLFYTNIVKPIDLKFIPNDIARKEDVVNKTEYNAGINDLINRIDNISNSDVTVDISTYDGSYALGSLKEKTLEDFQTSLTDWLNNNLLKNNASAHFYADANWVKYWNNNDNSELIGTGSRWTVTVVAPYSNSNYVQLRIATYGDEKIYYTCCRNGVWESVHQVAFTDSVDISGYVPKTDSGGMYVIDTPLNVKTDKKDNYFINKSGDSSLNIRSDIADGTASLNLGQNSKSKYGLRVRPNTDDPNEPPRLDIYDFTGNKSIAIIKSVDEIKQDAFENGNGDANSGMYIGSAVWPEGATPESAGELEYSLAKVVHERNIGDYAPSNEEFGNLNTKVENIETNLDNIFVTKKKTVSNGSTLTVESNVEYIAEEEISNLTVMYPDGDFICSLNFTLANEGDITITLPESKYIGGKPTFDNGQTWELNIKNSVVVGGIVE